MADVPEDINRAATDTLRELCEVLEVSMQWNAVGLIARAILAERKRCAEIAESWTAPLRPGTEARLLGHKDAARDIAAAIRKQS